MGKTYHRSLLANIYLLGELINNKNKIGDNLCGQFYDIISYEIHCRDQKKYANLDFYKDTASVFHKVNTSQQMNKYKSDVANNNVPKRKLSHECHTIELVADIHFLNLLLYDIDDKFVEIIKNIIETIHGCCLEKTDITQISRSDKMANYKEYLLKNREKQHLKNILKKPGFIPNMYLFKKAAEKNHNDAQIIKKYIEPTYNIVLSPELIKAIFESKMMATSIQSINTDK